MGLAGTDIPEVNLAPQYTRLAKMVGMESSERIQRVFSMIADLEESDPLDCIPNSWRH